MNVITTLSSKGQLVVPKAIRERQGWKPGDQIELVDSGAGVFMRAVPAAPSGTSATDVFAAIDAIVARSHASPVDDAQAAAMAAQALAEADSSTRSRAG